LPGSFPPANLPPWNKPATRLVTGWDRISGLLLEREGKVGWWARSDPRRTAPACDRRTGDGRWAAKWVALDPQKIGAMYGSYYETFKGAQTFIIANVLTDIQHDGVFLMHEGEIIELSLSADGPIKYVCLEGPKRLSLSVTRSQCKTTSRHDFIDIDKAPELE
jgi:hypothetical protein